MPNTAANFKQAEIADDILSKVVSVDKAVKKLLTVGVKVSERTLREKARRIGAYREIGQAMFFLPEDLQKLMEPEECLNSSKDQNRRIGSRGEPLTVGASKEARDAVLSRMPGKSFARLSTKKPAIRLVKEG